MVPAGNKVKHLSSVNHTTKTIHHHHHGHEYFSHHSGGTGRNVIIFGVDMNSSSKIDNKGKDILILGKGPT